MTRALSTRSSAPDMERRIRRRWSRRALFDGLSIIAACSLAGATWFLVVRGGPWVIGLLLAGLARGAEHVVVAYDLLTERVDRDPDVARIARRYERSIRADTTRTKSQGTLALSSEADPGGALSVSEPPSGNDH